ncbi:hypothetical protein COW36_03130 [bacterium (Candidatus Blackallbacteria) CG17_big_fil_post_rev_8_21_14_2_50_48_46]|uniref:histidine kinase n=1 Tax=bacterium (Candidatus Blackallbacteria) CG17_big_fil_post_rev_8_21_14_2_50_48_46 TaxID=2014261 RepID=A0A2M7G9P3_9BACT|nr:MAG: hypothetical protein COW64_08640 [bacterium (Candidatus Blackallbacteria) CG18_big_fil_WC_8_21_14_2_50_49_26]PIW18850.1 MAG: hypothetical protein COW36_03130 [bacterium (Candidatus Blackallbacteria) CG17_big_fil_post_rev_8_21_14_2_50_48_46]PIW44841.1 MAG: hypothetical protein COW20_22525 [bacterium (Candidatus Blackallbacteria) CG13_big_fil_rev_8_21_14_2_50_49_14]
MLHSHRDLENSPLYQMIPQMPHGAALYRMLYDEQGTPVDYLTLRVNANYERLIGVSRQVVEGQPCSQFLPDSELKHWLEIFGPVSLGGPPVDYEIYSETNQKYFTGSAFCPEKHLFITLFKDISSPKLAEEALKREKSLLSGLVHTIPDPVWLKDPEGRYLSCNQRFEELYGASEIEIRGKQDTDFVSAELANFFRENDLAAIQAGHALRNEEWLTFASDGYTGLFETIKTPMYDSQKNLIGVLGIARDITNQKQTETSLKRVNQTYAVLSAINEAVIRIRDKSALFQEVCRIAVETGAFRMAWIGQKTLEGDQILPLCHAGYSKGYVEKLHLSLSQQQGPTSRAMLSGSYRICNDIATDPIMEPWREEALERGFRSSASFPILIGGEVVAAFNLYASSVDYFDAQEIELLQQLSADLSYALEFIDTETRNRKILEDLVTARTAELKISERRFRSLIEGVQQEYFFFTVGENHEFTYLSPSAEAFLGQDIEKMLGQPWYQALNLDPEAQSLNEKLVASMLQGQEPPPFEIEVKLKQEPHFLEINEHILRDETGKIIGGEGVVKDITRQKQIEAELREAKLKAEKSSLAKSKFLAHMSHEIRTPLNSILGFSELMQEQIEEPRWQNYLQAINSSGKTLLHIINDILDLSKIEAGKVELQRQSVNLRALIHEIELLLRLSFEQKGLNLLIEITPTLPAYLWLDPLRLRQILLNLLNNALKYTAHGQVSLSLSFVNTSPDCGDLSFQVSDTGPGISEKFQQRIFMAFEQDPSSGEISTGTGLGLAITRSLVELMHGQIRVQSQMGKGSQFIVELPQIKLSEKTAEPSFMPRINHQSFAPARLLLVDDLPQNLTLLQAYLENEPFELLLAQNGQEACSLAEQFPPHLILMDIRMPIMDGSEALIHLKANPLTAQIPVVALTAFSLQQEENNFLKQGFEGYLRKPVSKSDLWRCLQDFLPLAVPLQKEDLAQEYDKQLSLSSPPLDTQIQNKWLQRWENIRQSVIIDELESFAQDLYQWAHEQGAQKIEIYANTLLQQLQQFALEAVTERLQTFPGLLTET